MIKDYDIKDLSVTGFTKIVHNVVLHHSADNDGMLSAFIIRCMLDTISEECACVGANFEHISIADAIIDAFPELKTLYITDYHVDPVDAVRLMSHGIDIVIIDHHVSAIQKYTSSGWSLAWKEYAPTSIEDKTLEVDVLVNPNYGNRCVVYAPELGTNNASAAYLAYAYVWMEHRNLLAAIERKFPKLLDVAETVSVYDAWISSDHRFEFAKCFNYGTKLLTSSDRAPHSEVFWQSVCASRNDIDDTALIGRKIVMYLDARAYENTRKLGGLLEWEGVRWLAMNGFGGSDIFSSEIASDVEAEGYLTYEYSPAHGGWSVGMYGVSGVEAGDFSLIAKKYGGGGHARACGFSRRELPFDTASIKPVRS